MHSDTPQGKDSDTYSRTLRDYHKFLWSKKLPNGKLFQLISKSSPPYYLYYNSDVCNFQLSSDTIIHTYSRLKRNKQLSNIVKTIPENEITAFYNSARTIGGYTLFPANRIDGKPTINGIRGMHPFLKDRFDFALECIRRWYIHEESPLAEHIERYHDFFQIFGDFKNYVNFFLLDDLVSADCRTVRFWLPFTGFGETPPLPAGVEEYRQYMKNASAFSQARNKRIENWVLENTVALA
jgi:hypothetical protein